MTHTFSVPCQLGGLESLLPDFCVHLTRVDGMYGFNSPTIRKVSANIYKLSFKLTREEEVNKKMIVTGVVNVVAILTQRKQELDVKINDANKKIGHHFDRSEQTPVEALRTLFLVAICLQTPDPAVEHALDTLRARGDAPKTVEMTVLKPKR